ncbi:MAG: TMEM43 family protein [Ardenticatenales bacterium]|nr:TMEM43 family protein [Ardenticatenales bacterium]
MSDRVTVTTHQSWVSRVGGSFAGALFGLLMALASFPLLFWNEGRAVTTARTLNEGSKTVLSVSAEGVDVANDGKLVHMTGLATTAETLTDPTFDVSANALKLTRSVEMYQWQESSRSETKTKLGGGQETVTTYTYDKGWSDQAIDSSGFQEPDGHQNTGEMPYDSDSWTADRVTLGAFVLPADLVAKLGDGDAIPVPDSAARDGRRIQADRLYIGKDPDAPAVGDVRIRFTALEPQTVSVVAAQSQGTLEAYTGAGKAIEMAAVGTHTAESMFADAKAENTLILWFVRLFGYLLMAFGILLVFNPLGVIGSVIPFVGRLMGFGAGLFSFLIAVPLTLITIALGWVAYRPVVAVVLIAIAVGVVWLALRLRKGAVAKATGGAAA